MKINFQTPPKYLDEKMLYNILKDYKMLNCEVLIRDENATVDDCKCPLPPIAYSLFVGLDHVC